MNSSYVELRRNSYKYFCLHSFLLLVAKMSLSESCQHQHQHDQRQHDQHQPPSATQFANVVLMCGLPGSGKSSFAAAMMRNVNNNRHQHMIHGETGHHESDGRIRYDPIVLIDYDEIADSIIVASSETASTASHEDLAASESKGKASANATFTEQDLQAWRDCRDIALSRLEEELRQYFSSYHQERTDDNGTTTNLLIILDDNFHLRSMRRDVYKVCQKLISDIGGGGACRPCSATTFGIGFSVLMVDTPMETCLKRNALREGKARIPEATVQKMASTIERPEPNSTDYMKKFETNSIVIDTSKAEWMDEMQGAAAHDDTWNWYAVYGDATRACLEAAIKNPVVPPKREEEIDPEVLRSAREQTKKNRIHHADRLLRSLVGVVGRTDKSVGRAANDARKHVLQQVRDEIIPVDVEVCGDSNDDNGSAYEIEIVTAFKEYLERNETCQPNVLLAIVETLHK